ncbi:MAG: alpha/beta fold hydrolase [Actinomycetales bacterium]
MHEGDLRLDDGRTVHWYDTGPPDGVEDPLVVYWHHGTPNIGSPPAPLFDLSHRLGVRWVSHDRPGYGGSTPQPGRTIADVVPDVVAVTAALGVDRFAVMGHSGGGPPALACAALLPDRVQAVAVGSSLAPYDASTAGGGLDWFAGMADEGPLRAALAGRATKEAYEATGTEGMPGFIDADWQALDGEWSWFGQVVPPATVNGPAPLIDDDLSYVAPWGFDVREVRAPVLVLHGSGDGVVPASHGEWLARHLPDAELWLRPGAGHVSVLAEAGDALDGLVRHSVTDR